MKLLRKEIMSKDNTSIAGEIVSNVAIFGGTLIVLNLAPRVWKGLKHKLGR